jgi:polysaccharide biosynthesis protein PslH
MAPRILYVCSSCPFAPHGGSQQRTLQIGRLLKRIGPVSMVLTSLAEWSADDLRRTAEEFDLRIVARFLETPIKAPWQRLRRELDPNYLNTHGFGVSAEVAAKLRVLAGEHDVVWIHTLRLANAFRLSRLANAVLDIDDVPSCYWRQLARTTASWKQALDARRLVWQWRRRERQALARFSTLAVCSREDRAYLGEDPRIDVSRIHVIPNGFDLPAADRNRPNPDRPNPDRPRLGIIGSFAFLPNVDGLQWFLDDVWPAVKQGVPNAELRLIGTQSEALAAAAGDARVTGLGYVDDPAAEIGTWSAFIVPLRLGAGTRVKIAESFARGCATISTSLGAFGYAVRDGEEILIADTAAGFAEACRSLLTDPARRARLGRAGRDFFVANLSWDAIEPAVRATVDSCLARRDPAPGG